jgi:hypothetical protein
LPETRESLGKYRDFPRLKSNFPHPKSNFPQRLSNFRQRLSAFLNGFPLSSMAFQFSSTAFHFPRNPRKSIYGSKYTKDRYSSFVFPATCSPSFVIPATMSTSPPTLRISGFQSFSMISIFFHDLANMIKTLPISAV